MPQASDELRAKFPGWDAEAEEVLKTNFTVHQPSIGIIKKRNPEYQPTEREWDAIDYLFHEWDYVFLERSQADEAE